MASLFTIGRTNTAVRDLIEWCHAQRLTWMWSSVSQKNRVTWKNPAFSNVYFSQTIQRLPLTGDEESPKGKETCGSGKGRSPNKIASLILALYKCLKKAVIALILATILKIVFSNHNTNRYKISTHQDHKT